MAPIKRSAYTRPMKHALSTTRQSDFAAWYQEVVAQADLAEESGVRGCMVIRPWGMGIWERCQALLDQRIKATGAQPVYFPLFIPLSYFAEEAEHVEGFAKEMAVVTHTRLVERDGTLIPDPAAKLEEPLVVRPTSETMIGQAFARWIQSWRDLPVRVNQWANVVRWEMRTRMFLRTSEFLWQEGHTAHADEAEARAEALTILELYRAVAEDCLAIPVVAGEKPEHERFPGAVATWSIEAMMQDGRALQAGTTHYLGTGFAEAAGIRYQTAEGDHALCHTTSWGVSTRLIGGLIMTHGDDDGLRVPPLVAPAQVVIVPMLRGGEGDETVLTYCRDLAGRLRAESAFGEPLRVMLDDGAQKASAKRWAWVKKGAPLVLEVGPRDVAAGQVSVIRRDRLYTDAGKLASAVVPLDEFVGGAGEALLDIQRALFAEAEGRTADRIHRDIPDMAALERFYDGSTAFPGWVEVQWSKPTGAALDAVVQRLKALKLTVRNVPMDGEAAEGVCFFTGAAAVERVLVGRAY